MNNRDAFNIWAPPDAAWSAWVKPVLFAHMHEHDIIGTSFAPADTSWAPPADGGSALVLDLPGALGVELALELARKGYRPVPLYNAVPHAGALCDLSPIVAALAAATPTLAAINLPLDAPPAFLLDADRRLGTGAAPTPGMFDNRSVSLPTDFPSANLLLSRQVRHALLVQATGSEPQADLSHTLLRWQQAGIQIAAIALGNERRVVPITVRKPPFYRVMWQRLLATAGLRRHPLGGFGGILPMPSAG